MKHVNLDTPEDKNRIWRYMDLAAFISILSKSALHFSRVDTLDDPFEGSFPQTNVELRAKNYKGKMGKKEIKLLSEYYKEFVKHTFVNCWHINQGQSAAMWKLYLSNNEGIAIRSTFGKLKRSFSKTKEYDVYIGNVQYIRYSKDTIPEGTLYPYFFKRKSFEHEQELRAVIQDFSYEKEVDSDESPNISGLDIPINLNRLIDRVVLPPNCPPWQKSVIKSILEKYGVDKIVSSSTLYTRDERILY